jgi:hypothetical protein
MIGESTSVSKSGATYVFGALPSGSPVIDRFQSAGIEMVTSCGRATFVSARVMNVGAPFSMANAASTQLLRTPISRE